MLVAAMAGLTTAKAIPVLAHPLLPGAIGLPELSENTETVPSRNIVFLEAGEIFSAWENLFLAFPLASILGLFGNRT